MADYFFKIFTSLRNCNVACSPALRLGGASEQLSGLCLQKVHRPLFKLAWKEGGKVPRRRMSEILIQLDLLLSLLVIDGGREEEIEGGIVFPLFVPALETSEKVRARSEDRISHSRPRPYFPESLPEELSDSLPQLTQPFQGQSET